MGKMTLIIDSNIWNYYFDQTTKEYRFVVKAIEEFVSKEEIAVNTPIIIEVSHYLIKRLGTDKGKEKVDIFLELPLKVVDLDYELIRKSLELFYKTSHLGIGGRDSTILATLHKVKTRRIFTHDNAFKRIKWLKVIDPIPKNI